MHIIAFVAQLACVCLSLVAYFRFESRLFIGWHKTRDRDAHNPSTRICLDMQQSACAKSLVRKLSACMVSLDKDDSKLVAERASCRFFLARWRRELLIDETEGDADAIELARRILDYYLDQYNQFATVNKPAESVLQILTLVITAPLVGTVVEWATTRAL